MKIFGHFFKLAAIFCLLAISVTASAAGWVHVGPADSGFALLQKSGTGNESYTRFGEEIVIQGGDNFSEEAQKANGFTSFAMRNDEKLYLLISKDPAIFKYVFPGTRTVWSGYGMKVLIAGEVAAANLYSKSSPFTMVKPLPKNETVITAEKICKQTSKNAPDEISKFLELLDMDRYFKDLEVMVDHKTRYSYVKGAMDAIETSIAAFKEIGLETEKQPFNIGTTQVCNLIATWKGTDEEKYGQVLVTGHLDSTSPNPRYDAPGADDNGSGSAGVLALARMLKKSGLQPAATIKFVLFLGEEQGLYGSKAYVRALSPEDKKKVKAVLNLDMIGFDVTPPLSIMLETNSFNKPMIDKLEELAEKYADFSIRTSFHAWGSDHAPFLQQKVPAVLTIESEYDANPNYHQTSDLVKNINPELSRQILRLNAAAMFVYGVKPQ
ncbi:MAG: hypothetical protein Kow0029_26050 [Candidatus Rifleibacteriota bacterium]